MKMTFKILLYKILLTCLLFSGTNDLGGYNKSLNVTGEGTLSISLQIGEINIETWSKSQVRIVSKTISDDDLEFINLVQEGNNIEFDYDGSYYRGSAGFKFYIPENFNIIAKTSSGDVRFTGVLDGNIEIYTAGGDIRLDDILGNVSINTAGGEIHLQNVGGNIDAETYGGDIEIKDTKGEKAEIKTRGGSITLGKVAGELSTTTFGGDINIESVSDGSSVNTHGGDIRIRKAAGEIRARTNGGDIRVLQADGYLDVNTSGGDVTLKNITGGVDAKTSSGSIYAEINPKGNKESELKSSYGEIELFIPANSDVLIDAKIRTHSSHEKNEIKSDFKAASYKNVNSGVTASYKIGNGRNLITISTVGSDITIKKNKN